MLWFLIVSLFARAAVGVHDDVATSVCEAEWFDARASWTDLDLYCQNWQGPRIYQCLDLFSHSQRLARTFTRHAKQAVAFDIASNQQEDILARSGFYLALDLVLMLLALSLAHFLMFPCVFLLQGFPMISGHPKYFEISQIYRNTAKWCQMYPALFIVVCRCLMMFVGIEPYTYNYVYNYVYNLFFNDIQIYMYIIIYIHI